MIDSTGGNTGAGIVDLHDAWNLLKGHRGGVKIVFEGGDIAKAYLATTSLPLVILDSLLMLSSFFSDDADTTLELNVFPAQALALAHNPDTPPRAISDHVPPMETGYLDLVTVRNAGLLYHQTDYPGRGVVSYYSDTLGAGVHRIALMFFRYDAMTQDNANRRILRNIVEWVRPPDFQHGVLVGRCAVLGGSPENICVSGGTGTDTTQDDGRFTLITDPGIYNVLFSSPDIIDSTVLNIEFAPGVVSAGFVAVLRASDPVLETDLPASFEVAGAYPNPFNGTVAFDIVSPSRADVSLTIFDIDGRKVFRSESSIEGKDRILWDTSNSGDLPSGIYFYRIESGGTIFGGRVLMVK